MTDGQQPIREDTHDDRISRAAFLKGAAGAAGGFGLVPLLAACGGSSGSSSSSSTAVGAPKRGGQLRVAYVGGPSARTARSRSTYSTMRLTFPSRTV